MNDPFIQSVAEFIDSRNLIAPRGAVLAAVSGGTDSVAMLAALRELAREPARDWRLMVAHLDHGIRTESAADAAFVAELAWRWQLRCVVERVDVPAEAERTGLSIEEAARRARYAFFASAAGQCGAALVATAHHADDNVETILYRILRGTHLRGLAGIPAQRPLGTGGLALIRPLLACRRRDIEAFLSRRGLAWRTDATNADTAYRRNLIRHQLLPLARQVAPDADGAILRVGLAAAEAEEYIAQQARAAADEATREGPDDAVVIDPRVLLRHPPIIQRYALRCLLERCAVPQQDLTAEHYRRLCALLGNPGGGVMLPGLFAAVNLGGSKLVITSAVGMPRGQAEYWQTPLKLGDTVLPDGRVVSVTERSAQPEMLAAFRRDRQEGQELLDADAVVGPLVCRTRRRGERFTPLGAAGTQTVSNFLTNAKLPARRRSQVVCVCDQQGLVYLAPLRIADGVKLTPATRRVLAITIRPAG